MSNVETKDILPDSRLKAPKGAKPSRTLGWWTPVFCAICGVPYGYVPEENCTFACWLCNECSETHGAVFGTMMMPDEEMWKLIRQEQLDRYQRLLSPEEFQRVVDEDNTALAKLLKEKVKK